MNNNLEWLHDDIVKNRELLDREDSQLNRRNYLRSLSSFYELTLSNLRERTAKLLVDKFVLDGEWRFHEITPLMDEMATLSGNGRLRLTPYRQPFLSLVAYTLKTYSKIIRYPYDVLSDNRWEAFSQTVNIRNRITHPKFHSEINITDDELPVIDEGRDWWNYILRELWETHHQMVVGGTFYKIETE